MAQGIAYKCSSVEWEDHFAIQAILAVLAIVYIWQTEV